MSSMKEISFILHYIGEEHANWEHRVDGGGKDDGYDIFVIAGYPVNQIYLNSLPIKTRQLNYLEK